MRSSIPSTPASHPGASGHQHVHGADADQRLVDLRSPCARATRLLDALPGRGGGAVPTRVKEEALRYFGLCLYEFYGSTELGSTPSWGPRTCWRKPGSCGGGAHVEIALLDDDATRFPPASRASSMSAASGACSTAYYKNARRRGRPSAMGGIGRRRGPGGRDGFTRSATQRDMIISGASTSTPRDRGRAPPAPAIEDGGVFGCPTTTGASGPRRGAAAPAHTLTADELRDFARRHLADYKVPRASPSRRLSPVHRRASSSSGCSATPTGWDASGDLSVGAASGRLQLQDVEGRNGLEKPFPG